MSRRHIGLVAYAYQELGESAPPHDPEHQPTLVSLEVMEYFPSIENPKSHGNIDKTSKYIVGYGIYGKLFESI